MIYTARSAAIIFAGFLTILLSACNHKSTHSTIKPAPTMQEIVTPSIFINQIDLNKQYSFEQSPWGQNITLSILEEYYSALGEPCITVSITHPSMTTEQSLLCTEDKQRWQITRKF